MKTSIVVPVYGKAQLTHRLLVWLRRDLDHEADVEVIVVDDGSPDDTRAVVEAAGWARLVAHDRPRGFAAACNAGAEHARSEYVLFLNNDTEGHPRSLERLVSYADATPAAAAVGAKLLYANETVQHAGIVIGRDLLPRHVYRGFPAGHPAVSRSRPFQAVTGACMLVRRWVFDEAGGFDDAFANGFEDVDLCLRFGAAGHEIHYCAESVLVHDEAATRGEDADGFAQNAARYLERWGSRVAADELATYVEDELLVLEPGDVYPLRLRVAPELAVVDADELEAFRLLRLRGAQVFDLLKENTALRTR